MPLRNWTPAMNRFAIEYEGRFEYQEVSFTQIYLQAHSGILYCILKKTGGKNNEQTIHYFIIYYCLSFNI